MHTFLRLIVQLNLFDLTTLQLNKQWLILLLLLDTRWLD